MIDQLLATAADPARAMTAALGLVRIDRSEQWADHDPAIRHLYRGHVLVAADGGWEVWELDRPHAQSAEGWACDMAGAMDIVDELLDD